MFSVNLLIHALKVAMEDGLTVLIRLKKDSWHYGLTNTEIDNYVARFYYWHPFELVQSDPNFDLLFLVIRKGDEKPKKLGKIKINLLELQKGEPNKLILKVDYCLDSQSYFYLTISFVYKPIAYEYISEEDLEIYTIIQYIRYKKRYNQQLYYLNNYIKQQLSEMTTYAENIRSIIYKKKSLTIRKEAELKSLIDKETSELAVIQQYIYRQTKILGYIVNTVNDFGDSQVCDEVMYCLTR